MTPNKTAMEQMISLLRTQVKEAKDSMNEARQYGVNSVGFNAYMGQMEMAESMLEQAQLLAEESKPHTPSAVPSKSDDKGYLPKGRTCRSCAKVLDCKVHFHCDSESIKCAWEPCRYVEYHTPPTPPEEIEPLAINGLGITVYPECGTHIKHCVGCTKALPDKGGGVMNTLIAGQAGEQNLVVDGVHKSCPYNRTAPCGTVCAQFGVNNSYKLEHGGVMPPSVILYCCGISFDLPDTTKEGGK